ncbi:cytochrome b [Pseudoduganella ginsengisoli]|uniref:Cytochrome b n=1 Tax=Pseudoduganella ginsengisoli TaxID=1462440 RepID=A0A6L6Q4H8_9BURK|nr:cytochrome b [Pseudoduganella ginsengisoli]MTW04610.1 cytochrome b [Pseudoduganella ginsengisoli]
MRKLSSAHHDPVAQLVHWATAALVLSAFIAAPEEHGAQAAGNSIRLQLHETLGLAVFGLSVVRVLWRFAAVRPVPAATVRWMALAASSMHGVLYLLLFSVPLSAIASVWLQGHALTLFAGISISPMLAPSPDAGEAMAEVHEWLGDALLWLAGCHALAALFHHYILKDGILLSMLPRWRR